MGKRKGKGRVGKGERKNVCHKKGERGRCWVDGRRERVGRGVVEKGERGRRRRRQQEGGWGRGRGDLRGR